MSKSFELPTSSNGGYPGRIGSLPGGGPQAVAPPDWIAAINPANGQEIERVPTTPAEDVAGLVARSKAAQASWGNLTWQERRSFLSRLHAILSRDSDAWALAIRDAIGKPRAEALAEVVSTLDSLRWTVKHAGKALADEWIGPGWQRFLMMPTAHMRWMPLGVVGMIGTWNYPLFLNMPTIAQALAAGNGVVWKPSELAAGIGRKLQAAFDEAGFPNGLVTTVQGRSDVGNALLNAGIAKGLFTGGVENGRRVLGELGRLGIPGVAELAGFDPALVLPDAPREATIPSLLWASFIGSGQTCIAVKRAIIVGDRSWARSWAEELASLARSLRVGDPASNHVDVGPMISQAARERFHGMIEATVAAGAEVLHGGKPLPGPGSFYAPTVLWTESDAAEAALAGCFGPVILVRPATDIDHAISIANGSPFALGASVWGKDVARAQQVARRVEAGMVVVNDAVSPCAHAGAPFGGGKASGFGRVHGTLGLLEFAQPQALYHRAAGGFRPQLFPYNDRFIRLLHFYRRLFHRRRKSRRR